MFSYSPDQLHARLAAMQGKRVIVLGDFMLDRYFWGNVNRISPEAPVPIVEIERETEQLGGAANVANNLISLGARPYALGVVGNDSSGSRLLSLMQSCGFDTAGMITDFTRPTTIKSRVIAHAQHVVRTDRESRQDISSEVEGKVLAQLNELMPQCQALVIEDYNKGVLTPSLVPTVIERANRLGCIIAVDPKFNNFLAYRHVTVFKPNRKETEAVLGLGLGSDEEITAAGETLLSRLECHNVLITLGADGMALIQPGSGMKRIPTIARHVHDVSGAGDTVIATMTLAMASGASVEEAATLANYAAGVVVAEVGAVPIDKKKLIEAIAQHQKWDD